jgi:hypothetical protein
MAILRIQHSVPNFDAWKRAFDSDPMERRASGVRRYHVYRATADPNFVMIDLEFESAAEAGCLRPDARPQRQTRHRLHTAGNDH